jgi:hypothetical protein
MRKFTLGTAAMLCGLIACAPSSLGLTTARNTERCSFVKCVDHCLKNGEAPRGTSRGGGGCGKFCQQKGCK